MKLIFFDESKSQPDYPHYHVGAVCIDEADVFSIEAEINAISRDVFGDEVLSSATEFHACDLYHRRRNFSQMNNPVDRIEILERFLNILSKEEVCLIDIQINTARLLANQEASDVAFMFLCERADSFVSSRQTIGMLIGDRESDKMSEGFSTDLSKYRARGTDFAFGTSIESLFESVHFTHSHLSRFLQLADVYTWILQFRNKNRDSDNPKHRPLLSALAKDGVNLFPSKYKERPRNS